MKKNRTFRIIISVVTVFVLCLALTSCYSFKGDSEGDSDGGSVVTGAAGDVPADAQGGEDTGDTGASGVADADKPIIEITMENGGTIQVELDPEAAPITVANFLKLVSEGFYDGLTFHRIIPNFMIQGGDPTGTGMGGADEEIKGEFASNGWDNPISHVRGVISMARSRNPDSASSQFFITNADAVSLDGDYAAFGTVVSGMDVVDEISAVPTDSNDYPQTPVVIQTIKEIK
ncbi:hypothetical protein AGMMS49983_08220 [Clostridia bacterium]|nr:hypothetical protein AGMMS49983_08220 [Clostridia bacterium]